MRDGLTDQLVGTHGYELVSQGQTKYSSRHLEGRQILKVVGLKVETLKIRMLKIVDILYLNVTH